MKTKIRFHRLRPDEQLIYLPPNVYTKHDCSSRCCSSFIDGNSSLLRIYGPLIRPLLIGWRRINKQLISYITPCGLTMRNFCDIKRYLNVTECQLLDVDNFCFERRVDCLREYVTDDQYILCDDLSNGTEAKPIRVSNEYNSKMPEKFTYVTQHRLHRDIPYHSDDHRNSMICCECTDDCSDRNSCPCWQLTLVGSHYDGAPHEQIYQNKCLYTVVSTGIYECNSNCKCSTKCTNRVAQQPITHNFEVFMTKNCGWGVRCLNDLPRGAFICCYFGHLQTKKVSIDTAKRHGDNYMATLDFLEFAGKIKDDYEPEILENIRSENDSDSDEHPPKKKRRVMYGSSSMDRARKKITGVKRECISDEYIENSESRRKLFGPKATEYIIDGKRCGNFGRFFNHSCEPNLFMQNVFIDTHDIRFPRLAFFTLCEVQAGTELRLNYNYVIDSIPNRVMYCECKSKNCRGRLL